MKARPVAPQKAARARPRAACPSRAGNRSCVAGSRVPGNVRLNSGPSAELVIPADAASGETDMQYVLDVSGGRTWFRLETEGEALRESEMMHHAVDKYYRREQDKAAQSFRPRSSVFFEQEIGLKEHVQREM